MQVHEASTAIYTEFLARAAQSLSNNLMRRMPRPQDRIDDGSEGKMVWRIDRALLREQQRETERYGAVSRFKKLVRGA